MFIQYDITSTAVVGIDTLILFHRNLESEVKDAGSLCWSFELRCKCVSCGVDCFIPYSWGTENSSVQRRKVEADMQGGAQVRGT